MAARAMHVLWVTCGLGSGEVYHKPKSTGVWLCIYMGRTRNVESTFRAKKINCGGLSAETVTRRSSRRVLAYSREFIEGLTC